MAKKKRAPKRDWLAEFPVDDYMSALAHLAQRAERVRWNAPIGNRLRLVRDHVAVGTVSVVYHQTAIVTYEPDGTQVLDWGGWFTRTTFDHIQHFARLGDIVLRPYNRQRNGHADGVEFWRKNDRWPRTPAKMQKCRSCKGTGRSKYAVSDWHDGKCYGCLGERTRDYGSKVTPEIFDETFQLVLDPDGTYDVRWATPLPKYACTCALCSCGCGNWQQHWANHVVPKHKQSQFAGPATPSPKYAMGGEVADKLTKLLPGLRALVDCPKCRERNQIQVRDQIVHLNDVHRATREEIADWLDALDVDLTFPVPARGRVD